MQTKRRSLDPILASCLLTLLAAASCTPPARLAALQAAGGS